MTRIALVGNAGSGKTTIANALARNYDLTVESLAAPLKAFAALAYGPVDKDAEYIVAPAWTMTPLRLTGRQLLQRIGTEVIRDTLDGDFWVKALGRRLAHGGGYVVDDARFANEVAYLRGASFMIVRLTGRGFAPDGHVSEDLGNIVCDLEMDNSTRSPNDIAHELVIREGIHRQWVRDTLAQRWTLDNKPRWSGRGGVHG